MNNSTTKVSCPGQYPTISAAVAASASGDTVIVCNGVYPEQVTITIPLTLEGQPGATIQPVNAVMNAVLDGNSQNPAIAIVYVLGAPNVTISGLIIDGSSANVSSGCTPDFLGIYYSGSSGTIVHNAVRFIELPGGLFGCQTGLAIYADNPNGASNTVLIEANSVHDFQKNGITASDTGLTATISGNTILGAGPTPQIAQNGVQMGPGGTGAITGNNASGFVYSVCTAANNPDCGGGAATGLLVYDALGVTITGNTLGQSQGAVFVYDDDPTVNTDSTITKNAVTDTLVYDGIGVESEGNSITLNTITNSAESGVALYASGNSANSNTIFEAPAGILIAAGSNAPPTGNKYIDVPQGVETSLPTPHAGTRRAQPVHAH